MTNGAEHSQNPKSAALSTATISQIIEENTNGSAYAVENAYLVEIHDGNTIEGYINNTLSPEEIVSLVKELRTSSDAIAAFSENIKKQKSQST